MFSLKEEQFKQFYIHIWISVTIICLSKQITEDRVKQCKDKNWYFYREAKRVKKKESTSIVGICND